MVFSVNNTTKKDVATIRNGDITEQYECSVHVCTNPVCTCGTVKLKFYAPGHEDQNVPVLPTTVMIDIKKKKLDFKDGDKFPEESLRLANLLISRMDDDDFFFLWERYFEIKNTITEEATADSIEACFDYPDIERNGLMSAYNDVLPYGDQLLVKINGNNCMVFDQYCLLPACPCTEIILTFFSAGKYDDPGEELYSVKLDYEKKKWKWLEGHAGSVVTRTVREAIEEQIPDIYDRLLNRHIRLKDIYFHCRENYFAQTRRIPLPKVSRNDPCPCGSGKKYKNCCLQKSTDNA
jgi:hypothetical protein